MLFHAEVDEFVILYDAVVVVVVPEHVFYKIVYFWLCLLQDGLQELPDFLLLELFVVIGIEGDHLHVDHFSHLEGQDVGGKLESLLFDGFLFPSGKGFFFFEEGGH